jgi:uncharacterized protein YifE (UPF0438 family)
VPAARPVLAVHEVEAAARRGDVQRKLDEGERDPVAEGEPLLVAA